MPRRVKVKNERRDWRWYASFALNAAVALSMVLGTIFLFTGGAVSQPPPIIPPTATFGAPAVVPTSTPAAAPTPAPTPGANLNNTAPPTSVVQMTFAVAGDSRDGDAVYKRLLAKVSAEGNAFLIHLGDMVSGGTKEEWGAFQQVMSDFKLPFYPLIGNHEIRIGNALDYVKYSGSKTHYSFDKGTVHFTMVDSSAASLLDGEFTYLDNDLQTSTAPVKMVFVHHPPFDPAGGTHIMANGNDRFMEIMKKNGVKYVFSAHIHCYEQEERDGIVYIVTGGAGAPLTCLPAAGGFYHYIQVQVDGTNVKTTVRPLEAQ